MKRTTYLSLKTILNGEPDETCFDTLEEVYLFIKQNSLSSFTVEEVVRTDLSGLLEDMIINKTSFSDVRTREQKEPTSSKFLANDHNLSHAFDLLFNLKTEGELVNQLYSLTKQESDLYETALDYGLTKDYLHSLKITIPLS